MKAFRPLVMVLSLALTLLPGAVVHAAQSATKVETAQGKTGKPAASTKTVQKATPKTVRKQAVSKSRKARSVSKAVAKPLPKPNLDLSLPRDMVNKLEPDVSDVPAPRKALLPAMFPEKATADGSPFQLNGRLISNEMDLQMRNESRRDLDGAAIDFQFRN